MSESYNSPSFVNQIASPDSAASMNNQPNQSGAKSNAQGSKPETKAYRDAEGFHLEKPKPDGSVDKKVFK